MKGGRARKKKPTYCGRHGHGPGPRRAKVRYRDLKDAKHARSGLAQTLNHPVRVYGCPVCGGYHLTTEAAFEWGNQRTVWRVPDRTISSEDTTEEEQDG